MRGRFITLEGIEGAGKSTLALALRDALHAKGVAVELTREPGGTLLSERLRDLVLTRGEERVSSEAETLIMFASRAVHLDNLVRPALERGTWVICDRFTDATRAYQGGGRGVSTALIEQLAQTVHAGLEPDLTLLLDLPVEEGLRRAARRRADRGDHTDRFESETVAFFARVRERYLHIADSASRCERIDALQPAHLVQAQALAAVARLLEQHA